jgi:hypothetical protein
MGWPQLLGVWLGTNRDDFGVGAQGIAYDKAGFAQDDPLRDKPRR